mgnify:CR=1 FL=1
MNNFFAFLVFFCPLFLVAQQPDDEVNTFEWVIETLIDICDQTPEQAEQCTLIIHYKGKCGVKTGSYDELKPQCSALLDAGLSAEIQ